MKKLILTLIFLTTVFAGYSQTGSENKKDTCICVTASEMINAIKTSDSLQVAKRVIQEQDKAIEMQKKSAKADSVLISEKTRLNEANKFIITNLDKQVEGLTRINRLMLDNEAYLKNRLRLQKRKTFFITSAFVTVIGAGVYFLAR